MDSSCTKLFLSLAVDLGLSWIPILISLPSSEPITKLGSLFSVFLFNLISQALGVK